MAADFDVKHRSRALLEGPARAAARAFLYGIGFDEEALAKPIVGVATTWTETMPCNFNQRALAAKVKEGIRAAGGTPMEFNSIAISDGITMGTSGMRASLVSREIVADSIELVADAHFFDALVCLSGCDKTIPGAVMALARLNIPSVMLYGGAIAPGHFQGHDVTIGDVFEAIGAHAAGKMSDEELEELAHTASPGMGACSGQFTANTMAMAFELLRISPLWRALEPAEGQRDGPGREPDEARGRPRDRRAGDGRPETRPAPERHHHQGGAGERDRRSRDVGRLDQRRAAPARGRHGGRHRALDRRLRPHLRTDAAAVRSEARRPVRRDRPVRGRRHRRGRQAHARGRRPARGGADGHRPHDGRGG